MSGTSKLNDTHKKIEALREIGSLRNEGIISEREFEALKAELIRGENDNGGSRGESVEDFAEELFRLEEAPDSELALKNEPFITENITDGIDFSLDDIISETEAKKSANVNINENISAASKKSVGFVLNIPEETEVSFEPIIPEKSGKTGFSPSSSGRSSITDGIDFSLDPDDVIDFSKSAASAQKGIIPEKAESGAAHRLGEIKKLFMPRIDDYISRDSALMDTEALEGLSTIPLFIMGGAAAVFFYYVLNAFADINVGLTGLLIMLCIGAGVLPACIIIPNTVKINRSSRRAAEADEDLREFYRRSGCTELPYRLTSPYIIEEMQSLIRRGEASDIGTAADMLMSELLSDEALAAEKNTADLSDNDELAARSAALYVIGKGLLE